MSDFMKDGYFMFYYTDKEYHYILEAIKLIEKNISFGLIDIENNINQSIKNDYESFSDDVSYEQFKEFNKHRYEDVRFISSTINEAFIIKMYTIFEKALIEFSYEVQSKYECKIPPDFNLKSKYTNIDTALEYISNLSYIDMKNVCNYGFIKNIRTLRNKLSHGNTILNYNKQDFKSTNDIIEILIKVDTKDKNNFVCRVHNDISILKKIYKEFRKILIVLGELSFDIWRLGSGVISEEELANAYNQQDLYTKRGNILGIKNKQNNKHT